MDTIMNGTAQSPELAAIMAQMAALQAQNEALAAKLHKANNRKLTLKVSEKGAVAVYGMGRFPVTLYREQWERLLAAADDIREFIKDNVDKLSVKD